MNIAPSQYATKRRRREKKSRRIENGTTIISTIVVIAVYCVQQSILSLYTISMYLLLWYLSVRVCCTMYIGPSVASHFITYCIYPSINSSIHQLLCPHISTIVDGHWSNGQWMLLSIFICTTTTGWLIRLLFSIWHFVFVCLCVVDEFSSSLFSEFVNCFPCHQFVRRGIVSGILIHSYT